MGENKIESRIGVLDGIRAIAIGMVVWFHFWQQTWLTPYLNIPTKYTKYRKTKTVIPIDNCGNIFYNYINDTQCIKTRSMVRRYRKMNSAG